MHTHAHTLRKLILTAGRRLYVCVPTFCQTCSLRSFARFSLTFSRARPPTARPAFKSGSATGASIGTPLVAPSAAAALPAKVELVRILQKWHDQNGGFREIVVSPTAAVLTRADVCDKKSDNQGGNQRAAAGSTEANKLLARLDT